MAEGSPIYRELEQQKTLRLLTFVNQPFLADCTLTSADGKEFKAPRVVIAAGAGHYYRAMREGELRDKYAVPEPLAPRSGSVLRPTDVLPTVLRYLYANQDPSVLTEDSLNKSTAFPLFALAHVLEVDSLVEYIGTYISKNVLTDANSPEILFEGLKYQSQALIEAAEKRVVNNFGDLVRSPKGLETLVLLPLDVVIELLSRSELNAQNEGIVFGFVCSYVQKRERLPVPPSPEEQKVPSDPPKPLTLQQITEQRLGLKPLSDDEKLSLFHCVRYPFLSHSELLQAASNSLVAVAKDLVLEGLSVQLSSRSGPEVQSYTYRVNRTPRNAYLKGKMPLERQTPEEQEASGSEEETEGQEESEPRAPPTDSRDWLEERRDGVRKPQFSSKTMTLPKPTQSAPHSDMYRSVQQVRGREPVGTFKQDTRELTPPRPPQQWPKHSRFAAAEQPFGVKTQVREFEYLFDFDDNGVFFFLGSLGKTRPWENPHLINQVKVFASSVGAGHLEDFVGRSVTMLRTDDEPNSYFGVDLGPGRLFLPSAYTIRNRNSTSHVMFNWHFEGSVNRTDWKVIDRRLHLTKDPEIDQSLSQERESLRQRGATSTWGVSQEMWKVKEGGEEPGFRYFRIVQIDKNSSGSYNLGLSGFEMYGLITAGRWP